MKRIGLTGGIGSGKTTVARVFQHLSHPVYLADPEAKRLTNTHPEIRKELIAHFGQEIYDAEGKLNKSQLAGLIFTNEENLRMVNQIIHPRVMEDFQRWSLQQKAAVVFFESAILFENGLQHAFDAVIGVTAPEEVRLQRVMKRDGISPEQIRERMQHQGNEEMIIRESDFLLRNDEEHPLLPQIMAILKKFKNT